MAEQNNELLLNNHQPHLPRSMPLLEANAIFVQTPGDRQGCEYGRGRGKGHGHDHGHGRYNSWHCNGYRHS